VLEREHGDGVVSDHGRDKATLEIEVLTFLSATQLEHLKAKKPPTATD
jgi:hypothetical protein